jgi:hypothetical protein
MENTWVQSHGAWWARGIDVLRMVLPDDLAPHTRGWYKSYGSVRRLAAVAITHVAGAGDYEGHLILGD